MFVFVAAEMFAEAGAPAPHITRWRGPSGVHGQGQGCHAVGTGSGRRSTIGYHHAHGDGIAALNKRSARGTSGFLAAVMLLMVRAAGLTELTVKLLVNGQLLDVLAGRRRAGYRNRHGAACHYAVRRDRPVEVYLSASSGRCKALVRGRRPASGHCQGRTQVRPVAATCRRILYRTAKVWLRFITLSMAPAGEMIEKALMLI